MAIDLSMRILIVDDYKTMLRIIRGLLNQLGFRNIDEALSGGQALEKLRKEEFGMVLSDWNMEPMNGYELLQEVRADQELKHIPFVMVTSESNRDHVVKAKKAGVNSYIIKPFDVGTLKTKISAALADFH